MSYCLRPWQLLQRSGAGHVPACSGRHAACWDVMWPLQQCMAVSDRVLAWHGCAVRLPHFSCEHTTSKCGCLYSFVLTVCSMHDTLLLMQLLNPKWAKAMAAQGSGGAYEISQRMTALVGWGATVNYTDAWTWDQVRRRKV